MSFITADIEKPPATVFSYLLYHGGIEPRIRVRRADALSFDERELISRGLPLPITTDYGPEFAGKIMDEWAYTHGAHITFIQPGKSTQNRFIENLKRSIPG